MSDLTLPPFFPLVRKECEKASQEFFQCLQEKTSPAGETQAAVSALQECKLQQSEYEKCTNKSLNAKGAKKPLVLTEWETNTA